MKACILLVAGLCSTALAQQTASPPQPPQGVDEVVVPGTTVENLRVEIERLEEVVYTRWNALNDNDEFDIQCLSSEPTGSNITQTRCMPKFVIQAESAAARNRLNSARNNSRRELETSFAEKSRQLQEEMQRVAREDEQFLRDLVRLDELRQQQASQREERRSRR